MHLFQYRIMGGEKVGQKDAPIICRNLKKDSELWYNIHIQTI